MRLRLLPNGPHKRRSQLKEVRQWNRQIIEATRRPSGCCGQRARRSPFSCRAAPSRRNVPPGYNPAGGPQYAAPGAPQYAAPGVQQAPGLQLRPPAIRGSRGQQYAAAAHGSCQRCGAAPGFQGQVSQEMINYYVDRRLAEIEAARRAEEAQGSSAPISRATRSAAT